VTPGHQESNHPAKHRQALAQRIHIAGMNVATDGIYNVDSGTL
jgi:hypothetical protein